MERHNEDTEDIHRDREPSEPVSRTSSASTAFWDTVDQFLGSRTDARDLPGPDQRSDVVSQLEETVPSIELPKSSEAFSREVEGCSLGIVSDYSLLGALDDSRRLIAKLARERDYLRMECRRVRIDRDRLAGMSWLVTVCDLRSGHAPPGTPLREVRANYRAA